ncbi:TPA: hypothetical protein ACNEJR_003741 [Escherichia coli]
MFCFRRFGFRLLLDFFGDGLHGFFGYRFGLLFGRLFRHLRHGFMRARLLAQCHLVGAAHLFQQVVRNRHQLFRVGVGPVLVPQNRRGITCSRVAQKVRNMLFVHILHFVVFGGFVRVVHELGRLFRRHLVGLVFARRFRVCGFGCACWGLNIAASLMPATVDFDIARLSGDFARNASGL